jgi:uncharacterized protein (DUF1697 family)
MGLVVFLRGVNVGGHKSFRPSALAAELADFDVVNVGAAGTFVVRKPISQVKLRDELTRRMPIQAELMICRAIAVLGLVADEPFSDEDANSDVTRYVSVLSKRPKSLPPFPIHRPDDDAWQVKVIGMHGLFALSLHRRQGRTLVYPNEVVEKHFGVSATTRNWNTIASICDILNGI